MKLHGDSQVARRHLGVASKFMDIMKARKERYNMGSLKWQRKLPDGSTIRVLSTPEFDHVDIFAPDAPDAIEPQPDLPTSGEFGYAWQSAETVGDIWIVFTGSDSSSWFFEKPAAYESRYVPGVNPFEVGDYNYVNGPTVLSFTSAGTDTGKIFYSGTRLTTIPAGSGFLLGITIGPDLVLRCITMSTAGAKLLSRPFLTSYENDDPYEVTTNPNGWQTQTIASTNLAPFTVGNQMNLALGDGLTGPLTFNTANTEAAIAGMPAKKYSGLGYYLTFNLTAMTWNRTTVHAVNPLYNKETSTANPFGYGSKRESGSKSGTTTLQTAVVNGTMTCTNGYTEPWTHNGDCEEIENAISIPIWLESRPGSPVWDPNCNPQVCSCSYAWTGEVSHSSTTNASVTGGAYPLTPFKVLADVMYVGNNTELTIFEYVFEPTNGSFSYSRSATGTHTYNSVGDVYNYVLNESGSNNESYFGKISFQARGGACNLPAMVSFESNYAGSYPGDHGSGSPIVASTGILKSNFISIDKESQLIGYYGYSFNYSGQTITGGNTHTVDYDERIFDLMNNGATVHSYSTTAQKKIPWEFMKVDGLHISSDFFAYQFGECANGGQTLYFIKSTARMYSQPELYEAIAEKAIFYEPDGSDEFVEKYTPDITLFNSRFWDSGMTANNRRLLIVRSLGGVEAISIPANDPDFATTISPETVPTLAGLLTGY